jgi:hypothetical protein
LQSPRDRLDTGSMTRAFPLDLAALLLVASASCSPGTVRTDARDDGRDADDATGDGDGGGDGDGDGDGDGQPGDGDGDDPSGDGDGDGDADGTDVDASTPDDGDDGEPNMFDPRSVELCELVNEYRMENGLPRVPISVALMTVAEAHVGDLAAHPELCNMHSWSDTPPWSGCCFDFDQGSCMWDKPREITAAWGANQYTGNGYEDSTSATTPEGALDSWKGSKPHNDVILNQDIWENYAPWPAMGCAVNDHYSVLWMGDAADPQPEP